MKKVVKEWGFPLIMAYVLVFLLNEYIMISTVVPSESMVPTIQPGDRYFVNKMVDPEELALGDIVVFYPPVKEEADKLFIKRLIGKEGDQVQIKNGVLYRNGKQIKEPYVKEKMSYEYGPVTIPKDHFLFLGDNRNNSFDAHLWSVPFVEKEKVVGKAVVQYYPVTEMKIISTITE